MEFDKFKLLEQKMAVAVEGMREDMVQIQKTMEAFARTLQILAQSFSVRLEALEKPIEPIAMPESREGVEL